MPKIVVPIRRRAFIKAGLAFGAGQVLGAPFIIPARGAAPITIGIVGPMTGEYDIFGKQFVAGAEMAVNDISAAGGVMGNRLKIAIGDDACDPKQAVMVANDMAAKKAVLVVGHYCSPASIAASKVYAERGIIQISPASSNPKFTDERPGPGIFRLCGRDDLQGEIAGRYLAGAMAGKRVAFVNDQSMYGRGLMEQALKAYRAAGDKEVLLDVIRADEKDYSSLVAKIKQVNADVVYLGGYHTEAGLILRQMREQGLKTIMLGGDAFVSTELWDIAGESAEGTLLTFSPDPQNSPAAADVVKRFGAKSIEPEGYTLQAYAAVETWKQAAEKAKSFKTAAVIKAMNEMSLTTVLGTFRFDEKGDPSLPSFVIYKWSNGKYKPLT